MTDNLTPTFIEMALGNVMRDLTLAESREAHLLVAGKSARLLRPGDIIVLREIADDDWRARTVAQGIARVRTAFPSQLAAHQGTMRVVTDRGVFTVPASRLLVVHHPADPFEDPALGFAFRARQTRSAT